MGIFNAIIETARDVGPLVWISAGSVLAFIGYFLYMKIVSAGGATKRVGLETEFIEKTFFLIGPAGIAKIVSKEELSTQEIKFRIQQGDDFYFCIIPDKNTKSRGLYHDVRSHTIIYYDTNVDWTNNEVDYSYRSEIFSEDAEKEKLRKENKALRDAGGKTDAEHEAETIAKIAMQRELLYEGKTQKQSGEPPLTFKNVKEVVRKE